jgi:large subunit ribosomal protein L9
VKLIRRTVSLLLLEDLAERGEVGEIIEVKPGYARNYLIPAGIGTPPSADALAQVVRGRKVAAQERADRAANLAALAADLHGRSVTVEERASEEGHLFGSVGIPAIVAALSAQGVEIEEKAVVLAEPIKELGIFNVPLNLGTEDPVEIRVWVVEPDAS